MTLKFEENLKSANLSNWFVFYGTLFCINVAPDSFAVFLAKYSKLLNQGYYLACIHIGRKNSFVAVNFYSTLNRQLLTEILPGKYNIMNHNL